MTTAASQRGIAAAGTAFGCLLALAAAGEGVPHTSAPLPVQVSWIGNTHPGVPHWVPQDIDALCAAADGRVFSNVRWEEGGGNVVSFRDGEILARAGHTHGWGHHGGYAVAANQRHLFIACRMSNEGGNLVDPATWPPKGREWIGVSRRALADIRAAAPFPGAKGGKGGTLREAFLVVDEVTPQRGDLDRREANITGLCASAERLWVSCPYDGTIKVFHAETMERLAAWPFERAGGLALGQDGVLWVLRERGSGTPPAVVALGSGDGRPLGREARFPEGADPAAICLTPDGRLLAADDGPAQQILVFDQIETAPRLSGVIGKPGGIFAGPAGEAGPLRFNRPRAIACDPRGNLVVAHRGSSQNGSTVLEAYDTALNLLWRLHGLTFIDMADVDPGDDTVVLTKEERFEMDYRQSPGREWTYRAFTVDPFRFPDDPRRHIHPSAGAWARRLDGHLVLFVNDMNGESLQVYRFAPESHGATAIPSGLFARRPFQRGGWPPQQPEKGEWIWRDADGDGQFGPGEFFSNGGPEAAPAQRWWVDDRGGVWLASETKGIRHFPFQGCDAHGNPVWNYASARHYPHPAEFESVKRLRYDPATDTLYLGGTTREHRNQHWKPMGPVLARYDRWAQQDGAARPRWSVALPYVLEAGGVRGHSSCEPMGFDVAGDHLFVPYTGASRQRGVATGRVEVFRIGDGASVGHFEPSAEVGEVGLQDIRESLRAHRRADGEYLVFVEDDFKAKILLYRWRP